MIRVLVADRHQSRSHEEVSRVRKLTERQIEVLQLVAAEKTDKEISRLLGVTVRTVRYHLRQSNLRLETKSRVGAVVEAMRQGFIQ